MRDSLLFVSPVRIVLAVFAAFLALAPSAHAAPLAPQNLWNDPQWRALLHMRTRAPAHGESSLIQGDDFFLSGGGEIDPRRELEATLAAFTAPLTEGTEHAICRYPARYAWLSAVLPELAVHTVSQLCPEFEEWRAAIAADRAVLVFPASFPNNPASAFGHTLLRLDRESNEPGDQLLAYSANFAAFSNPHDSALLYALRGVFGGYSGYFTVAPYYRKVAQYNDMEDRDIWEYELDLSPSEVDMLVRHLWELRKVPFSYYYFDENCSFALLSLLQAARPALKLTERFPAWALPVDTVRAVLAEQGAVRAVEFRPSKATVLRAVSRQARPATRALARGIVTGELSIDEALKRTGGGDEKALLLDLAYEFANYRILSSTYSSPELRKRAHQLLLSRSTIDAPPPAPPPVPGLRPDQGHETFRISAGARHSEDRLFALVGLRPVYHELLDPPDGSLPGSELVLGAARLAYEESSGVKLDDLELFKATSLSPRDEFIRPISWMLGAGSRREWAEGESELTWVGRGGAGVTYDVGGALAFGLITAAVRAGDQFSASYAAGSGAEAGVIYNVSSSWGAGVRGTVERFMLGDTFTSYRWGGEIRLSTGLSSGARLMVSRGRDYDDSDVTVTGLLETYF